MRKLHYLFIFHFKPQSSGNTYVLQGASTECQPTALALKTHAHRRCQLRFFLTDAQVLSFCYSSTRMQAHSQTPRHTHRQTTTCEGQPDRQTKRQKCTQADRQTDTKANGQRSIKAQCKGFSFLSSAACGEQWSSIVFGIYRMRNARSKFSLFLKLLDSQ